MAAVLAFVPSPKYEGSTSILLDASRGSAAFTGDERRSSNEVVTYDQVLRTQQTIAGSEDVIRKAVVAVGADKLYPDLSAGGRDPVSAAYALAKANATFTVEPNTFILKMSFRHRNPELAAQFTNQLASEYLLRRSALYGTHGDVDFFRDQEKRFNADLRVASEALDRFSREKRIYSIEEQRKLLLQARAAAIKERDDNATQVARTESELASLKLQLGSLRKNITLPAEIFGETPQRPTKRDDSVSGDPPLLNVKIYQESASKLVSMNAELAGLKATASNRAAEVQRIDDELAEIAHNEAAFKELQRKVNQISGYIENLSKRAGEARVNDAWRSNEAFSTAQVIQSATAPVSPVFPRPTLFMIIGVLCGAVFYGTITYLSHGSARGRIRSNLSWWTGWEPKGLRATR